MGKGQDWECKTFQYFIYLFSFFFRFNRDLIFFFFFFFISIESCWFAICTILAFTPWISAEEKLLYQTPNENNWGGWYAITDGLSSLNVIKVVVFCCFTQYPDYKHLILSKSSFLMVVMKDAS